MILQPFSVLHKNQKVAQAVLKSFLIGEVKALDTAKILTDFRQMKEQFAKEGLLDASPAYYVRKCSELLFMVSTSLYLLWSGRAENSIFWLLASSLLMAMFIFQCGWTTHDFLHNQVCILPPA